ncbi:pyridoxal phosphate-dependent aminotransferase [Enterocloster clostridioformis]|jgi:aspartate/methionine/tyrosine aminotransferase
MKTMFDINESFKAARTEYNQIYKNFLYINDYYAKLYQQDFVDLFSASTFSKVVPHWLSDVDYCALIKEDNNYEYYPSPEGDAALIHEFHKFIRRIYGLDFSCYATLICQGTMQAIDAISCITKGKVVFVMDSTVTFAKSIPTANGAKVVLIKTDDGIIDMEDLERKISAYPEEDRMYLYINYPNNPTGSQLTADEMKEVVRITQKYNLKVVHDHDICMTSYAVGHPSISIFSDKEAERNCIEIYTFSKEFGLSGLRVGVIVGNRDFIEMIKYHNYEMNVMIPKLNQEVARIAMARINPDEVRTRIGDSMCALVNGFRGLGWEELKNPQAGISFLLPAPKDFMKKFGNMAGEMFAFDMQKNFGIGVGPAKCNCLNKGKYIRVLSMEPADKCLEMFARISGRISPDMPVPESLYDEYRKMIKRGESCNVR